MTWASVLYGFSPARLFIVAVPVLSLTGSSWGHRKADRIAEAYAEREHPGLTWPRSWRSRRGDERTLRRSAWVARRGLVIGDFPHHSAPEDDADREKQHGHDLEDAQADLRALLTLRTGPFFGVSVTINLSHDHRNDLGGHQPSIAQFPASR
jgi:hypothetical protein